jgi:transcription antitermination factor NusG
LGGSELYVNNVPICMRCSKECQETRRKPPKIEERKPVNGDIVEITDGPLAGLLGQCAATKGPRVLVVVELQGRQVDVEMDLDWVTGTTPERRSVNRVYLGRTQTKGA